MSTSQVVVRLAASAAMLVLAAGATTTAAPPAPPQGQEAAKAVLLPAVPVRVDVALVRYQGERKLSSLPFSLLATAEDRRSGPAEVSMRMGIDVPVGTSTTTDNQTSPAGGSGATRSTGTTSTRIQYRSVGTDISCRVTRIDETQFAVRVNVSDSSIHSPDGEATAAKSADGLTFRTFNTSNSVVLRDNQSVLFGTGTDKVSGESLRIEVALHVLKQ